MSTLIATLGSEAQVVTITIDLLSPRGRQVQHAVVLHTSPDGDLIGTALARLAEEMPNYAHVRYTPVLLRGALGEPLADVDTPEGAAATFRALYQAIRSAKRNGEWVDVCPAGGRKTMSVYAMVAAQL